MKHTVIYLFLFYFLHSRWTEFTQITVKHERNLQQETNMTEVFSLPNWPYGILYIHRVEVR